MRFFAASALAGIGLFFSACGEPAGDVSQPKLRDMTRAEALADFNELVNAVKGFYGPLEYKQERFHFKLDKLAAATRDEIRKGHTDPEFFGAYQRFLAKLNDGHVSIDFPDNASGVRQYRIPVFITPVEGKAIVGALLAGDISGVDFGDEVISIDGKSPFDYFPAINKYSTVGYRATDLHFVYKALLRPFYITELTPTEPTAILVVGKPDGSRHTVELAWRVVEQPRAQVAFPGSRATFRAAMDADLRGLGIKNSIIEMGQVTPFFATPEVETGYEFEAADADTPHLAKFGLSNEDDASLPIYAARYAHQRKRVLLVRQHDYAPGDWNTQLKYIQKYKAILSQYEDTTDVLVIDQTHNPGGSYCSEFYQIFARNEDDAPVQFMNVDRRWINEITAWAAEIDPTLESEVARQILAVARQIEIGYDAGKSITDKPAALWGSRKNNPPTDFHWTKPMLVLIDELAGSCGDIFPMLVRDNGRAKLFGSRTMGLGGNVEEVALLTNSNAALRLTRGLFTTNRDDGIYPTTALMENNGVAPDYPYEHNVADFRGGFVGYVRAFSDKALEQIQ